MGHLDGQAPSSDIYPVTALGGNMVTAFEAVGSPAKLSALQQLKRTDPARSPGARQCLGQDRGASPARPRMTVKKEDPCTQ